MIEEKENDRRQTTQVDIPSTAEGSAGVQDHYPQSAHVRTQDQTISIMNNMRSDNSLEAPSALQERNINTAGYTTMEAEIKTLNKCHPESDLHDNPSDTRMVYASEDKSNKIRHKKEPSPLLDLFTQPKKQRNLKERKLELVKQGVKERYERNLRREEEKLAKELEANQEDIRRQIAKIDNQVTSRLNLTPKNDFKCLKLSDGSIYYGNLIEILPNDKRPVLEAGVHPDGFRTASFTSPLILSEKSSMEVLSKTSLHDTPSQTAPSPFETDEPWIVKNKDQVAEELKEHLVKVRHGYGIQIYGQDSSARYAGDWVYDQKTGEGHMVYLDGSIYKGKMEKGKRHGFGYMKWPPAPCQEGFKVDDQSAEQKGHMYVGEWNMDAMHGMGKFQHNNGHIAEPHFSQNLVEIPPSKKYPNESCYYNPFTSSEQKEHILKGIKTKNDNEAKAQIEAKQVVSLHMVDGVNALQRTLDQVRSKGRTPMIITSQENPIETIDLIQAVNPQTSLTHDLRLLAIQEENRYEEFNFIDQMQRQQALQNRQKYLPTTYENIQEQLKQNEKQALKHTLSGYTECFHRNILVDNDNKSEVQWPHYHDPDIKQVLFGKTGLPQSLWKGYEGFFSSYESAPSEVQEHLDMVYENCCRKENEDLQASVEEGNPPYEIQLDRNEIYTEHLKEMQSSVQLTCFSSNFKPSEKSDQSTILSSFKKRFGMSLPLQHIDCVLVQSLNEYDELVQEVGSLKQDSIEAGTSKNQGSIDAGSRTGSKMQ